MHPGFDGDNPLAGLTSLVFAAPAFTMELGRYVRGHTIAPAIDLHGGGDSPLCGLVSDGG
jgi:hypothetical protein